MKKITCLALAFALMITIFAGCSKNGVNGPESPQNTSAADSGKPVSISIMQYKVEIVDQLNHAIEQYKSVAPNVTITLETVGGGDDMGTVLKSRLQTGALPTIYNIGGPSDVELYSEYLEDLSSEPWVSEAIEGTLLNATKDGKVYGLPYAIEGLGLVYNEEIFKDAGVDTSSLNSFSAIESAFKKVKDAIDSGALKEKYPNLEAVVELPGAESWVLGDHAGNIALAPEYEYDAFKAYSSASPEFTYTDAYKKYIDLQINYSKWASNPAAPYR